MNKFICSLIIAAACLTQAAAHTISTGYINKQEGYSSGLTVNGKTSVSMATLLKADLLARYHDNAVKTVRISLPNTKIYVDSIVVWVRSDINGGNLATAKLTRFKDDGHPMIATGWNEVELSEPVGIGTGDSLYVGYTYYQRTRVCASCTVDSKREGISFWKSHDDGNWKVLEGETFAMEVGIDGDKMPANDIWLMAARGILSGDGKRQVEARVYNRGQEVAGSLGFLCEGTGFSLALTEPTSLQPDQMDTLLITLPDADRIATGTSSVLTVTHINGATDEHPDDNQATCLFTYLRKVLIEEFTTEMCPNCPRVGEYIHNLTEGPNSIENDIAVVCHHSGYNTDWLTLPADTLYIWFYNNGGGSFAPGVMYNRMMWNEGAYSPVSNPQGEGEMRAVIKSITDTESVLVLNADASYDNDHTLSVTVRGRKLKDFGQTAEKRVTVYLTEDNILAQAQAGSGTDTYYHQHVTRAINSAWGIPVEWNGDEFTYTCKFTLNDEWKRDDLKVVAAVGDYDPTNPCNCQIENTAVAIPSSSSAIHSVESKGDIRPVAFYSIGGTRLSAAPQHGLYITRYSDGSCHATSRP